MCQITLQGNAIMGYKAVFLTKLCRQNYFILFFVLGVPLAAINHLMIQIPPIINQPHGTNPESEFTALISSTLQRIRKLKDSSHILRDLSIKIYI